MASYNGKEPTVWMRSLRWHTYEGKPQEEGALYLAHEEMVETIEKVLKFAVREPPPPRAVRPTTEPSTTDTPPTDQAPDVPAADAQKPGRRRTPVMTTDNTAPLTPKPSDL
jgi:hypothetical protein